jgi:hypothetical protein
MSDLNDQTTEPGPSRVKHRLGMSRRDLLRRGAVVGGTLLWTVPVIKTISSAHPATGSPVFGCCECRTGKAGKKRCEGQDHVQCFSNGQSCANCTQSEALCQAWCASQNKSYCFHSSPQAISCVSLKQGRTACVGSHGGHDDGDDDDDDHGGEDDHDEHHHHHGDDDDDDHGGKKDHDDDD